MNMDIMRRASDRIKRAFPAAQPMCGIILGSGLGAVANIFKAKAAVNYSDIPDLGSPGIEGHSGKLVWAELDKKQVFIFSGRRHWYEGKGWDPVAIPIAILKTCGVRAVLITNAAGGVSKEFEAGDMMIIDDHINLMGVHPLVGPHDPFWGPRFPDMTDAYDARFRDILGKTAKAAGVDMKHGVYAGVSGPTYETPAEVRAFRAMGADAVGMSTVPETILAKGAGLRVAGISCVVNAALDSRRTKAITHDEVTSVAADLSSKLSSVIAGFIPALASELKTQELSA